MGDIEQLVNLGAGRHLRPEENSKNRKSEKKFLPMHQKSRPYIYKEKAFFWGGGGKNMSTITATPFEISTWNFLGMFL